MPRFAASWMYAGSSAFRIAITGHEALRTISEINSSAWSAASSEPDERDVGVFAGRHRPDFLDVDLACDHLVPEPGDHGRQ